MECPNTLTIRSGADVTVFAMQDAGELWFRQGWKPGIDKVVINLEAGERTSGGSEYSYPPSVILSWLDSPFQLDCLVGRSVHIPLSYSEEQEDHATNFYYGEHLDFDDVRIDFVERIDDSFRIRVTGKTIDIESDAPNDMAVEIDAFIQFVDRNSPPVLESPRIVDGVGEFSQIEWCWECAAEYMGRSINIRISKNDDRFDNFANNARALLQQEGVSLETMRNDINARLPRLKWKFDAFNVETEFRIDGFVPDTFTITEADKKSEDVHLYVFLTHPDSGTDNWILRFCNSECYGLEWIPDR
ncbi:hypothetical protein NA78x_003685 [Anatilimnocola sp. NA78]|uniref:hypothetical protein n=1 Tax=Anatilimnocola sp. NA78 TaxID=3415683 RepID=UPI003CE4DC10